MTGQTPGDRGQRTGDRGQETGQDRTGDRTGHGDMTEQGTGQDTAGQDRTGDRTRQDSTGQDWTAQDSGQGAGNRTGRRAGQATGHEDRTVTAQDRTVQWAGQDIIVFGCYNIIIS